MRKQLKPFLPARSRGRPAFSTSTPRASAWQSIPSSEQTTHPGRRQRQRQPATAPLHASCPSAGSRRSGNTASAPEAATTGAVPAFGYSPGLSPPPPRMQLHLAWFSGVPTKSRKPRLGGGCAVPGNLLSLGGPSRLWALLSGWGPDLFRVTMLVLARAIYCVLHKRLGPFDMLAVVRLALLG